MTKARYLYSELSGLIEARSNCVKANNVAWFDRHEETILKLVNQHMPSGSGFDSGTKIDLDASHADKLVFTTAFHHMDENGYYDGWTEHTIIVIPSLHFGFHLRVSGRNRNDIKELIHQDFDHAMRADVAYDLLADEKRLAIKTVWLDQSRCQYQIDGHADYGNFDRLDKARAFVVGLANA